jgi:hypothetical protein
MPDAVFRLLAALCSSRLLADSSSFSLGIPLPSQAPRCPSYLDNHGLVVLMLL